MRSLFVLPCALCIGTAFAGAAAGDRPIWTAGIVTDTHVGSTRESCDLVEKACTLFASRGIDVFIHCGDIADRHSPEGYRILSELTDAAFPAKPKEKIWVYADHDFNGRRDEPWETVMGDVKRHLGASNGLYGLVDMRGWPLLVFPQRIDFARAERMLSEACADPRFAGKPVFVFDHVPPEDTTEDTATWGDRGRRELYSKFPRAIVVHGHVHGSLRSELNIWQEGFTAVNMGCLSRWDGHAVGAAPETKRSHGAVLMEVFADRVVFRRYDVRTGEEYGADEPWTVPLPFDPATAPYRRDRAAGREPVPQFPAGAVLSLGAPEPFHRLELRFPRAEGRHGDYKYGVQVAGPDGGRVALVERFGRFWQSERERPAELSCTLSAAFFEPGRRYRVRVAPCNFFGAEGRALEAEFVAPEETGYETVFESDDPIAECPFLTGLEGGRRLEPSEDGWFDIGGGNYRLEFPDGVWGAEGRYRFAIDMETEQDGPRTWTLVLRDPGKDGIRNANNRIATPRGDSGRTRYVIGFTQERAERRYYLLVREGGKGRIRFDRVKIERVAPGEGR